MKNLLVPTPRGVNSLSAPISNISEMKRNSFSALYARKNQTPVSLKLSLTLRAVMDSPVGARSKLTSTLLNSFGAQIIQTVREGNLPAIRRILDRMAAFRCMIVLSWDAINSFRS